jgi:hypothetical protein
MCAPGEIHSWAHAGCAGSSAGGGCAQGAEEMRGRRREVSHPVLEGKPNANHVRARIKNSHTQRLHNWTSSHNSQNKLQKGTLLHQDVQDIHRV